MDTRPKPPQASIDLGKGLERLLEPRFRHEIHSFLWAKPIVNRGELDTGWSCRDHAAVLGAVVALGGHRVTVRHGRCMYVQGESGGHPPVGVGQEVHGRSGHTWLLVDGVGDFDLSPRLNQRVERWRPMNSIGVIGDQWRIVGDLPTRLTVVKSPVTYDNLIARATYLSDIANAIYYVHHEEPYSLNMIKDPKTCIDSPRFHYIARRCGPAFYVKLVAHLTELLTGSGRPLAGTSSNKALSIVDSDLKLTRMQCSPHWRQSPQQVQTAS